jgi:hypothetical protein
MTQDSTLADIIAAVQLLDVRLIEVSALTRIRDASAVREARLVFQRFTKVIQRYDDGFLVGASMRARVVGQDDETTDEPPVQIDVTFALHYALEGTPSASDEDLEEFARVNGAFNAWPYWREYIQTTAARMNLPPTLLPVFRVQRPKPVTPPVKTIVSEEEPGAPELKRLTARKKK